MYALIQFLVKQNKYRNDFIKWMKLQQKRQNF